ncbi:MAG: hydrogenase maturation protease, partial [Nocardioides sp.]
MAWSEAPSRPTQPTGSKPLTPSPRQPYELLDDGFAPDPCDLLVLGCGNILRGDDAVGPVLVRTLVESGLPDGVRVVDGGTAGMDVAFAMRGAARVVIVDAAATGAEAGTVYRVPAEELADLPPMDGLHSHNLRWDHALAFGSWLLGPHRPTDVTVYLIEGASYQPGAPLTDGVEAAMHRVADLLRRDHFPAPTADPARDQVQTVELTEAGYLHLPAAVAARHFPADVLLAREEPGPPRLLVLVPVHSAAHGG